VYERQSGHHTPGSRTDPLAADSHGHWSADSPPSNSGPTDDAWSHDHHQDASGQVDVQTDPNAYLHAAADPHPTFEHPNDGSTHLGDPFDPLAGPFGLSD
jgi:hypothetical protein